MHSIPNIEYSLMDKVNARKKRVQLISDNADLQFRLENKPIYLPSTLLLHSNLVRSFLQKGSNRPEYFQLPRSLSVTGEIITSILLGEEIDLEFSEKQKQVGGKGGENDETMKRQLIYIEELGDYFRFFKELGLHPEMKYICDRTLLLPDFKICFLLFRNFALSAENQEIQEWFENGDYDLKDQFTFDNSFSLALFHQMKELYKTRQKHKVLGGIERVKQYLRNYEIQDVLHHPDFHGVDFSQKELRIRTTDLWAKGTRTNLQLKTKYSEKKFDVHREIILWKSEPIKTIWFRGGRSIYPKIGSVFTIEQIGPNALEAYIEYLYCGKISTENVRGLVELLCFLEMRTCVWDFCEVLERLKFVMESKTIEETKRIISDSAFVVKDIGGQDTFLKVLEFYKKLMCLCGLEEEEVEELMQISTIFKEREQLELIVGKMRRIVKEEKMKECDFLISSFSLYCGKCRFLEEIETVEDLQEKVEVQQRVMENVRMEIEVEKMERKRVGEHYRKSRVEFEEEIERKEREKLISERRIDELIRENRSMCGRIKNLENENSDRMKNVRSLQEGFNAKNCEMEKMKLANKMLKRRTSRKLMMEAVPRSNGMMRCFIIREKCRIGLFNRYFLFMEGNRRLFLCAAKRRRKLGTSSFCFSLSREDLKSSSEECIGKLRSNFWGSKYYLFDDGVSHKKAGRGEKGQVRNQLGVVCYEKGRECRKVTFVLPNVQNGRFVSYPDSKHGTLMAKRGVKVVESRKPVWNENMRSYLLNFEGRENARSSVKNFQLQMKRSKKLVLQFGRIDDKRFLLDFTYPFSPFQAFCVGLSVLDFKICVE